MGSKARLSLIPLYVHRKYSKFCTIFHDLDMKKLSGEWTPQCVSADQKQLRITTSKSVLQFLKHIIDRVISTDQLLQSRNNRKIKSNQTYRFPPFIEFCVQESTGNFFVSIFISQA